ncbi:MAG: ABC transporter ATP-binding protein [Chloroflexota bacterium]
MNDGRVPVLSFHDVAVWVADGPAILRDITWAVYPGEHWALLGPNGSGKSTLLAVAGATRYPSAGTVRVLGNQLGQVAVWDLRERIGALDPAQKVLDWLTVEDVVLTGVTATVWPLPDRITGQDRERARALLEILGCSHLFGRQFSTCSQGERQRVRIARALMTEPPLLLLDEPATGLDLPAREALLAALVSLAAAKPDLTTVVVSHHLEELPPTTTHALLLRDGVAIASGRAADVLTSEHVSACFGVPVQVSYDCGRWAARATPGWLSTRSTAVPANGEP